MPRMTNGIGTWFCKAHFDAGWGWDDAVECAMFLYFPLWAYRVVHIKDIPGGSFAPDKYQAIPLRWSDDAVQHVFLRRWLAGIAVLGVFMIIMVAFVTLSPPTGDAAREWAVTTPILTVVAPCLVVVGIVGLQFLRPRARRERDTRRLLGLHVLGTSDPVSWSDEDRAQVPSAKTMFGSQTYAAAVPKLLDAGAWSGAMWAARLSAAFEDSASGRELTDTVLQHAGTQEALARFRRDPKCWRDVMGVQALEQYQAAFAQPAPDSPVTPSTE